MDSYIIRKAKESEIDSFIEWGNTSGWNMGAACTKNYYKDFPNGWFLGELSKSKEIIAKLYCTKYPENNIGFIGYFMVQEKFRGKGFGYQLFKYVLDNYLFPVQKESESELVGSDCCKSVGLYSAQGAIPYYEKFGFKFMDKGLRFKGLVNPIRFDLEVSNKLFPLSEVKSIEDVSNFDLSFSRAYRPGFWTNWGTIFPKEHCILYKEDNGTIKGLGALRPLPQGYRLGPLYANSFEIAQIIFKTLCNSLPQNTIIILDVLESNSEAVGFFRQVGLKEIMTSGYMWKGDDEEVLKSVTNSKGIYAVASLDFN